MPDPVEQLVGFARDLRDEGVAIGTGRTREFCRAAVAGLGASCSSSTSRAR